MILLLVMSCDRIDSTWHRYKDQNSQISGKNRADVTVVSHGWKLIDSSVDESGNYEWGWEVTIMAKKLGGDKTNFIGIEGIEYTLLDQDEFRLISSTLNLDDSGRIV